MRNDALVSLIQARSVRSSMKSNQGTGGLFFVIGQASSNLDLLQSGLDVGHRSSGDMENQKCTMSPSVLRDAAEDSDTA